MDKVAIANMALFRAGVTLVIQDINEQSVPAAVVNTVWENTVQRTLQDFPWSFANRYTVLALQTTSPVTAYLYRYSYPSDCIQIRNLQPADMQQIVSSSEETTYRYRYPYEVVEDEASGGRAIETDLESAAISYTAKIMSTGMWSPKFVNALAWALAVELVVPLASDLKYLRAASDAYVQAILAAGSSDMNEAAYLHPRMSAVERAME